MSVTPCRGQADSPPELQFTGGKWCNDENNSATGFGCGDLRVPRPGYDVKLSSLVCGLIGKTPDCYSG